MNTISPRGRGVSNLLRIIASPMIARRRNATVRRRMVNTNNKSISSRLKRAPAAYCYKIFGHAAENPKTKCAAVVPRILLRYYYYYHTTSSLLIWLFAFTLAKRSSALTLISYELINGCLLCQQSEARPLNPPFHIRESALVSLTRNYLVGVCDHFLPLLLRIVQFVARLFAHRVGHVTLVRKVIGHHVAELFLVARVFVFDGGRGSVEYSAVCDCDVLFGCEVQKSV